MERPVITENCVKPLLETKFVKVYDLQYEEGKHYFDATRHEAKDLTALKSDKEFKEMYADAVTCFVIVKMKGKEPRLLSFYEYRYPTGRFLLSPPAGLMDPEDKLEKDPLVTTAKREIFEETGLKLKDSDRVFCIDPCVFSTPGLTDEANALMCAVVSVDSEDELNSGGAVGSECFNGFRLLDKKAAKEILKSGRDENGNFYSVYMWAALMYFVSDMWED